MITTERLITLFHQYPLISTDSRQMVQGSIFFALRGESFNGNDFALQALQSGAAFVISDDPKYNGHDRIMVVDDVLSALQKMAVTHRQQFRIPLIAITGSNGKTTTKELVHRVLSKKFRTLATEGNFNNHIGVPLTLLRINEITEMAIVEMGANHPGEIDLLCRLAMPDFGLITNIGKAHLEGFGSFEGVVKTKTELYRYLQQHEGTIFYSTCDKILTEHAAGISSVGFGAPPARVVGLRAESEPCVTITMEFSDGEKRTMTSGLYGGYNAGNILAAVTIGDYFGVSRDDITEAVASYSPSNNRSQILRTNRNTLILDAYNANPSSMEAALKSFALTSFPSKVLILGDMLELGPATHGEHERILSLALELGFERILLVGPVFCTFGNKPGCLMFSDNNEARGYLECHPVSGAAILIKGSRGMKLEHLTGVL